MNVIAEISCLSKMKNTSECSPKTKKMINSIKESFASWFEICIASFGMSDVNIEDLENHEIWKCMVDNKDSRESLLSILREWLPKIKSIKNINTEEGCPDDQSEECSSSSKESG
jgi:hypothetical protein